MSSPSLRSLSVAIALVLSMTACGDDPTSSVEPDTTPPVITAVTPRDIYHVDVTFDKEINESSAQDRNHYLFIKQGALSPAASHLVSSSGDLMYVVAAVLKPNRRTVNLSTEDTMSGLTLSLTVNSVSDTHGNEIIGTLEETFTGSNLMDHVAPTVIRRSPPPGSVGAAVGMPVVIQFSEAIDLGSNAVTWRSGSTFIGFQGVLDGAKLTLTPYETLRYNEKQTIVVSSSLKDLVGNKLLDTSWSFTTTGAEDHTRPEVVSTSPVDLATNVDVKSSLSVTFSEPMKQFGFFVGIAPWPGSGSDTWSNGGRTYTFNPDNALQANQQYQLTIYPYVSFDRAGNEIARTRTAIFSTGPVLESGSIAGEITGDPGSGEADPSGAIVSAGYPQGYASYYTVVAANGAYQISHLPDGTYFLSTTMDSNHDGLYNPRLGDAFGAYGVDRDAMDFEPDSVVIAGGSHETGISFQLVDPIAIWGRVTYGGPYPPGEFHVGLFQADGFDPSNAGSPVVCFDGWLPASGEWYFNSFDVTFPDGDYYLFAYMNVNEFTTYEPGIDPAGMYGGFATPTVLHVRNGSDFLNIRFAIEDPPVASASISVSWPTMKHNAGFNRLCDRIAKSQQRSAQQQQTSNPVLSPGARF